MIYYRKTLFGRGPKLTAVHVNPRGFKNSSSNISPEETGAIALILIPF
jgi:hypothetical protein